MDSSSPVAARTGTHLGLLWGAATFLLLTATAQTVHVTWDEPIFSVAAERAAHWLGLVVQGRLAEAADPYTFGIGWGLVNEHPPLMRVLNGIGWAISRAWLPAPLMHRLGAIALNSVAVGVLVRFLSQHRGRPAAIFTGAALLGMPRLFFHMNLAALDFPLAAVWILATIHFYRTFSQTKPPLRTLFSTGCWLGLALLTKINAVLLAPFWGGWVLLQRRTWRHLWFLAASLPVALGVLVAGWPWVWKDPVGGLVRWVAFFRRHFDIGQWLAGQFYLDTPWWAPFLIVLITTPALLLFAAAVGAASGREQSDRDWVRLHLLGIATVLGYYALPITAIHDQDRLLAPAFVHLAILGGDGFQRLADLLRQRLEDRRPLLRAAAPWMLGGLLLAPGALANIRLHPFQLAYYNELIGGPAGAQRQGMETIYFASTYGAFLPELNQLPPNSTLWVMPNSWGVLYYYQQNGLLRPDLIPLRPPGWGSFYDDAGVPFQVGDLNDADFALIERRQTAFNRVRPEFAAQLDWVAQEPEIARVERAGVVLASLHRRGE